MIALLRGEIKLKAADYIILEAAGVGYQVQVPVTTLTHLPNQGETELHIHTHVREDALQLYGFVGLNEKQLFCRLLQISGVGPRLAMTILSHMPLAELQQVFFQRDSKRLAQIPGIGKKTAERLVLEMADSRSSQVQPSASNPQAGATAPTGEHRVYDDLFTALLNLGYKDNQAHKALSQQTEAERQQPMADQLKLILKRLAG